MSKLKADDFFKDIDYPSIIETIKGIYTSDGSMNTLLDFERVLDQSDLYAYRNWDLGELVSGPNVRRYTVSCMFMYPRKLMPDPRGANRLLGVGCNIQFKKTVIKVPVQIKDPGDYKPGTHYPKMAEREVWLINITIPKTLMDDIREGTIDLAGQSIDLEELDTAYDDDLDKESTQGQEDNQNQMQSQQAAPMSGQPPLPMPGM